MPFNAHFTQVLGDFSHKKRRQSVSLPPHQHVPILNGDRVYLLDIDLHVDQCLGDNLTIEHTFVCQGFQGRQHDKLAVNLEVPT